MTDHPVLLGCCCPALISATRGPSAVAASGPEDVPAGVLLLGRPERRLEGVSALQPFRSRSWPRLPEEGGPTPESAGRRRGSRPRAARARAAEDRRTAGRGGGCPRGPAPPPPCKMAAARLPRDRRWPRPRRCAAPPCGGTGFLFGVGWARWGPGRPRALGRVCSGTGGGGFRGSRLLSGSNLLGLSL